MKKTTKLFITMSLLTTILFQGCIVNSNAYELSQASNNISYNDEQPDPKTMLHQNTMQATALEVNSRANVISNSTKFSKASSTSIGTITANTLNIRKGASSSHDIIGVLNKGDVVKVLERQKSWYKISFNKITGYVSAYYVSLTPIEKGVDVSKWNGNIDWKKAKAAGINYAIIRAGYGTSTVDPKFKANIEGASKAGIKVGVYWFSYATSVSKAKAEAQKCLNTIAPYKNKISYPVFYDFEYASVDYAKNNGVTVTKDLATNMANAFLDVVEKNGYESGLYTNKDFGDRYFNDDLLYSKYLWIAKYNAPYTYTRPYMMLQFTETGNIDGIGKVDLNYTYLMPNRATQNIITSPAPIAKTDISSATISSIGSKPYTGSQVKPEVSVTLNKKTLSLNKDYTVKYENNVNIGTARVIISGIGNYKGSKKIEFKIAPQKITNVSLVKKGTNSITFSWKKMKGVNGYKIYYYDKKSNTCKHIKTIKDNTVTTFTNSDLKSATIYNYKVRAYKNVDGVTYNGFYSSPFTEHTNVDKVSNLKLNSRGTNSLNITWNKVKNCNGYKIYKFDVKSNSYKHLITLKGNSSTNYTDKNLSSATNYLYKVRAYKNLNGSNVNGSYSSSLKATTKPLKPKVSLSIPKSKNIKISWSNISQRATGYQVYMSTSSKGTYKLISTTSKTNFTKSSLTKGKKYYFKVRAYRTVDGKKIYSSYSDIKYIKCK